MTYIRLDDVVINESDINNIVEFFKVFNVEMPEYLQKAINTYNDKKQDQYTADDQELLRVALIRAMSDLRHKYKHPLFTDSVSDELIKHMDKQLAEAEITLQMHNCLSNKENS